MRVDVNKHINLEQLAQEIEAAGHFRPTLSASDPGLTTPGWVEIVNGVDVPDFQRFVDQHTPQPRPRTRREELADKARAEPLSPPEIQEAIRLWLMEGSGGQ